MAVGTRIEEEVIVGRWDCTRCGYVGNVGTDQRCAGCGAPRGRDVAFYLTDEAEGFTEDDDPAAAPDWVCSYCGSGVPADSGACPRCGAPRADSLSLATRMYAPGEEPRSDDEAREGRTRPAAPTRRGVGRIVRTVLAAVGTLFALLLFLIFYSRTTPATVTALTWERAIAVEENRRFVEGDWDVPSGGKELGRETRIRTYRDVLDHYETATRQVSERVQTGMRSERVKTGTRDNGNGTFTAVYETRSEPVYETRYRNETYQKPVYRKEPVRDTWHRYEIWRWTHDRDERAAGALPAAEPRWPTVRLGDKEREGERAAHYRASLREPKGRERAAELPEDRWRSLRVGGPCTVKTNIFGMVLEVR